MFWVRDSIIRERLADPAFGGNDEFRIEEDREGNPIGPFINWTKAIPWRNPNEDELRAIESVYRTWPGRLSWSRGPRAPCRRAWVLSMTIRPLR